ncbi:kinetochore scaffold 1 isoform X2 [Seriola lalandi dorsalis]|uniref:kinetochore scaffold 1 isoform X2 n=1 Tax=Seriola lalandi dorsalis TaxID=1841481 RepID=UPI000C6F7504|nr:kinetochore scaffold 1 isoform X2 [Seriola lalandi dorsalis]
MESQESAKNDESSGFSKRRISSILKAPRKSARFPDPEQQENVECARPVEKRNSRRVSFAPANDVLLFSKDVKNASPARSPLQEIMTATAAATTQNRVQVVEDGTQQIMGMATLLNAPLHASQQQDKVSFDTEENLVEKTVMFSTDEAFMDMTHSHTINIASDATIADISLQNYDALPTGGEKTVMFTAGDASMDMTLSRTFNMTNVSVSLPTGRNMDLSSSVPGLDPGFENFLASLSKPSATVETNNSLANIKTQKAVVDKENQVPPSVSAMRKKSQNASMRTGESSDGSVLCPEVNVSMDMTEAQTGRILGVTDDDDPFQCLFPTEDMYAHSKKRVSQTTEMMKTKQLQSSKTLGYSDPKDMTSLKNPSLHVSHPRHKVNFDAKNECREKTMMFTADDEFMDMTQSHTVNIAHGPLALQQMSAGGLDTGFNNFLASLSKPSGPTVNPVIERMVPSTAASSKDTNTNSSLSMPKTQRADVGKDNRLLNTSHSSGETSVGGAVCSENDMSMDLTEAQTGHIIGITGSDDPFQFLLPTQDMYPHSESLKKANMTSAQKSSEALGSSNRTGMETSLKPSLKPKVQRHQDKLDTEDDYREKTVRFSADDACMDVTQSHTVNITDFKLQSLQNLGFSPCREKTVRFNSNDAAMDMTECLTVNIDSNLVSDSVCPVETQESEKYGPPKAASSSNIRDSSDGAPICPEGDVSMDITEAQTGKILGIADTDDPLQYLFPSQDMYSQSGNLRKTEMTSQLQSSEVPGSSNFKGMENSLKTSLKTKMQRHQVNFDAEDDCREKTVRFSADGAAMDVTQSHTVNIAAHFEPQPDPNLNFLPTCGEKTVRFTADNACMDVTRSHTVNIASEIEVPSHQNVDRLPICGDKTVRFTANDAAMDVTRSHTVNITSHLGLQSNQNMDFLPTSGEKTVRFTSSDAAMDVTRSHTVNISSVSGLPSHQNVDPVPTCGEKTVRFTASDAAMDVTKSHTVNIASNAGPKSHQNLDFLPTCGEKMATFSANDAAMDVRRGCTVNIESHLGRQSQQNVDFLPTCEKTARFNSNDGAMDMTQCLTVNIASNSVSDSVLPCQESNIISTNGNADLPLTVRKRERSRSSSVHSLDPGLQNSLSKMSGPWTNPVITKAVTLAAPSPVEGASTNGYLQVQKPFLDAENVAPGFVPAPMEKPQYKPMTDCSENNVSMDMTEAQTGHILGQTCTGKLPQCLSSTEESCPNSDHLKETEATSQQSNEALGSSIPNGVVIANCPDSTDLSEIATWKEPGPRNNTSLSQKIESSPSAIDQDADMLYSRKSRRMSLADVLSKVRRLSHMINTAPDTMAMESCTAPLAQLDHDLDKNSKDETAPQPLPVQEPEPEMGLVNSQDNTQAQCLTQEEASTTTTPFNLKTKQLMSRLSMGGFKPKLPQRSKPDDPKKVNSVGDRTKTITVNVTNQMSDSNNDVSDIYDEELGSYEDMSETLDPRSPQKVSEKVSHSQEFNIDELLEEDVFEKDLIFAVNGKKRPLPKDDNNMEDEKRMKASTDVEMELQSHFVEGDGNISTAPNMTTHTTDGSSSSHTTSIRCEAAFESTLKQSLFESQLEDYASDEQKKLDDGTITVLEFFKLFNIDFVIHNPRQSILPGRILSDTDRSPMDLLKDRHISRPKQMVYETNVLNLTEKVEGFKVRMRDLDKPLKIVNRPLWEEMRDSSEKGLKSFGVKLKERNNFFRKTSKAQSHEMKEDLYSNLVQANLEEQQKLRGTIEKADEMIKSLDDCICELETELAAVEEKGFEDKPSLKSRQEEIKKVTEVLADNERQMSELELQKQQDLNKIKRLEAETRNFKSHVTVLHMVNEWRSGEKKDNCIVYTFLHDTMHLQLAYEKYKGTGADNQSERKISHITFKLQLDDEKSQPHARLVHKLLSQYIESETSWVEKYPTSKHVPKLLHDVGLVVSRCRLLGEELRLLKMWGGLRLDILNISCVDTQVHIVFSSLKKFSKFEVVLSVSLINHLCVLQVESFKNVIGSSEIKQIEEIVASFSPTKNLLTKIVKKIHDNLLC